MPRPDAVIFPRHERVEDRRKEGEHRKLLDEFFDHSTLMAISRLITQGQFEAIDYPISTGKEGGVFRATSGSEFRAVKVYRIGNAVFRRLPAYAMEQLKRETSEHNYARLVMAWTRREHSILRQLTAADVACPQPYGHLRNVLVMEFVGTDGVASPRLQEATIDDPDRLHRDLERLVRRMTVDAHLVHGDLSPYNVLYRDGHPVLIDVAQAIPVDHPQARELLRRDSDHFTRFLARLGVEIDADQFFKAIGGGTLAAKR